MALRFPDDPLYKLLREEKIEEFNKAKPESGTIDFRNCDFRGADLRGLNADRIHFGGSYFRGSDLRGIDFSKSNMHGCSLASAQISGCLFPASIDATEIFMSVEKGMRMRQKA